MNILKISYVLAIAALLTFLVIFSISTFYHHPSFSSYSDYISWWVSGGNKAYHLNVFFMSLVCGGLFGILSLPLPPKLDLFKWALLLGGTAIIIYAIAQAALAMDLDAFVAPLLG